MPESRVMTVRLSGADRLGDPDAAIDAADDASVPCRSGP